MAATTAPSRLSWRGSPRQSFDAVLVDSLTHRGSFRIVWPISAEQPLNAIHLSENLDVGFELIEVRHGAGAGKIYRTGRVPVATVDAVKEEMRDVLERAYGEEGARKRANVLSVQKKLQAAWAEDGIARREVETFLDEI